MKEGQVLTTNGLWYGNGCSMYPDCFVCPEKECRAENYFGMMLHREHIREYQRTGIKIWEMPYQHSVIK